MGEQENYQSVLRIYDAFGRPDVVLRELAEDVEWRVYGPEGLIPYAGVYRGHEGVKCFFDRLAEAVAIEAFDPREYVVQCDQVVAIGCEKGRAKPTGREFKNDWVHVFGFRNGKVAQFREFGDTAALVAAFHPRPT